MSASLATPIPCEDTPSEFSWNPWFWMIFRTKTLISMLRLEDIGSKNVRNAWKSLKINDFRTIRMDTYPCESFWNHWFSRISQHFWYFRACVFESEHRNRRFRPKNHLKSRISRKFWGCVFAWYRYGCCQGCRHCWRSSTSVCWKRLPVASPYNFIELPQYARRCWRSSTGTGTVDRRAVSVPVWSTFFETRAHVFIFTTYDFVKNLNIFVDTCRQLRKLSTSWSYYGICDLIVN